MRIALAALALTLAVAAPAQAAYPTAVNGQITDAVTQTNVKVLGEAPAQAMGNLFVATSQALSNAAHNATNNQQQSYVTMQASTTQAVATLYAVDTASTGVTQCATYLVASLAASCLLG
ncbi:MAG: RebB family R body protein [Solirubrobacteraceae bacterium]|nr:RebB family R body protein [Solirubrobacteraceae bacterium]